MKGLQLAFERDVREEDPPVASPEPGPENRTFTKPSERSTDIAPAGAWQAEPCSASSDFAPAASAALLPTDPSARSSGAGLDRHPLSRAFGGRTAKDLGRLRSAMQLRAAADDEAGIPTILDITLLDGQVLWDWDVYLIGLQTGMQLEFREFDGADPVAYLCTHGLHPRHLIPCHRALVVVSVCDWAGRGRPKGKKSTQDVDFPKIPAGPKTDAEMSRLAGVGTTLISKAKTLTRFGLSDRVLLGDLRFTHAYRRAQMVRDSPLMDSVLDGAMSFDEAYERAVTESPVRDQQRRKDPSAQAALVDKLRELERSHAELVEENSQLREQNAQLRAALATYEDAPREERNGAHVAEKS